MAGRLVVRQTDRVVEVAGIDRVDGHHEIVREVLPAAQVVFAEGQSRQSCLFQGFIREHVGQVEGADDRQGIHAGLAVRPKNFDDDTLAAVIRTGKTQHFEDNFVVRLRPLGARIADKDAVAEDGAIDPDETLAFALEVSADEMA